MKMDRQWGWWLLAFGIAGLGYLWHYRDSFRRRELFLSLVKQCAKQAALLLIILTALAAVGGLIQGICERFSNRSITPDEDRADVLHYTRYHWFVADEKIRLEARPDCDDTNRIVWQAQAPNGEWYEFFDFDYVNFDPE